MPVNCELHLTVLGRVTITGDHLREVAEKAVEAINLDGLLRGQAEPGFSPVSFSLEPAPAEAPGGSGRPA